MPTTVIGTCHHDCPDSCGWQVTVEQRERGPVAVRMRGNKAHPYSAGELCPKVNKFLDRVYDPNRVLTPLRRVGAKGEGRFERISWDQALAEIAVRWQAIIAEHGAEAIIPYSDAGNQSVLAIHFPERFWNRLGGSRLQRAICGPTVRAGVAMTIGTGQALDPLEIRHARLILLWGTNTKLTNRHLWPTVQAARADGAQVVVIDPLRTVTAEDADWFLQPLPGTDIAVMLAMMHVLIRDGLIDDEWVGAHTVGFDDLAVEAKAWPPERAGEVSGLPAADIERLATLYGTVRPAAIRTLIGAEHHENGAMFHRTMACLPALTGAWRERGGGFARSVGSWTEELIDAAAIEGLHLRRSPLPRLFNMSRLGEILTTPQDPPVRSMLVWNSNPLVIAPNAEAIRRGLERADLFTVVHEQFVTDTARYADIVLPATTQIESADAVQPWGHLWMGWNDAAIPPLGECVSNSELHRRLARAMGFTEAELFADDATALADALGADVLAELRATGWYRARYPENGRPFADGVFPTPSGKVELRSAALEAMGQPAVPTYVPPRESPGGDAALAARYPLQLMTPKIHTRFLNSGYSHLPKHGPLEGQPYVELSAEDAAARGLADGDRARVFNDRATLELPVRIGTLVRPGVVAVPWGWWASQHPDGRGANALTNDTLTDWGGGVAFFDTLVEVSPLED